MNSSGKSFVPAVTYPVVIVLALAIAACEEKPPAANTAPAPQAMQPPPAQAEPAKPAEMAKPAESPQAGADAALAAKIKSALEADAALKSSTFDVTVSGGVATLYGTADTRARRDRAAQIAAKVAGVKSVKNQIAIVAGS